MGGLTNSLAYLLDRLAYALADLSHSLPGTLSDLADGLTCAPADVFYCRSGAFTDALHSLAGALDCGACAGAHVLHG